MKHFLFKLPVFLCILLLSGNSAYSQVNYHNDFIGFWTDIRDHYAYLEQQNIDWDKVKELYEPQSFKTANRNEFIELLEALINELYNGHSSLNTNLVTSNRLVPSGSDLYVERTGNSYFIKDIRKGFGADAAGLKIGTEVVRFNGMPIEQQLEKFLPKFSKAPNEKMLQYALNMLFAGTHNTPRELTVLENGVEKSYHPVNYANSPELLFSKITNSTTAYIKINNSLGNNELISEFDKVLDSLMPYRNLIIDLTETPSGGNSTVARAIMGRFVGKPMPYQVHEFDEKDYETKRHWVEYVIPRKKRYKGKVYVLVGRWTGSMGEGIAIGFDAMKRASIIGTPMAGLLGAISNFKLEETGIGFQFPVERLYHVNGTPREAFVPGVLTRHVEETIQKARNIR